MKQSLLIQQFTADSLVKVHCLRPGESLRLGQERNAVIRLTEGSGRIDYVEGEWICLFNGERRKVSGDLQFGTVRLRCRLYRQKEKLFAKDFTGQGSTQVHLIVVKRGSELVYTEVLPPERAFEHPLYTETPLPPSKTGQTVESRDYTVTSRLARVDHTLPTIEKPSAAADKRFLLRSTAALLSLLLSLFGGSYFTATENKEPPLAEKVAELKTNRFTKMVYDSEEFLQARQRAQKILKDNFSEISEVSSAADESSAVSAPTQEVIKGLQASGLGDLIGKIAQRSVVSAEAVIVRDGGGGRAQRGLASATGGLSGQAGKEKGRFHLAGVETAGLAGDKGRLNGLAHLAQGRTGSGEVNVLEEETVIEGGLEPEVIAGVIRQHLGEVRYCYERQLGRYNDLEGKVQLNFAIGADGSVSWQKVSQTTLNNAMVEGCILRRVAKWKFPHPKGGTSVHVTYPFLLKSIN